MTSANCGIMLSPSDKNVKFCQNGYCANMCSVFKTIVSHYQRNNTYLKEKSFKECSEATKVKKEELQAMKYCFKELHMFTLMGGDIFSSEVRTEEAEF